MVALGRRQEIRNDVLRTAWRVWIEVACLTVEPGVARLPLVSEDLDVSRPPGDGPATAQLDTSSCQPSNHLSDGPLALPPVLHRVAADIETDLEVDFIKSSDAILGSFAPSWVSP